MDLLQVGVLGKIYGHCYVVVKGFACPLLIHVGDGRWIRDKG